MLAYLNGAIFSFAEHPGASFAITPAGHSAVGLAITVRRRDLTQALGCRHELFFLFESAIGQLAGLLPRSEFD
jgi:hypothetical protein